MPARETRLVESAFQKQTGLKLGKVMYEGDGTLYRILGQPNRVVKIVPLYSPDKEPLKILKYLQRTKNTAVVKLHRVGSLKIPNPNFNPNPTYPNPYYTNTESTYYYYVMTKLKLLPRKGRTSKVMSISAYLEEGERLSKGVPRQIKNFVKKARKLKYQHNDIHEWNIMQDKRGSLKFVDLESFMMY